MDYRRRVVSILWVRDVLFAAVALYPGSAIADHVSRLASYVCNSDRDQIIITNRAGYNALGAQMVKRKRPDEWELFHPVSPGEGLVLRRRCKLSSGWYEVGLDPVTTHGGAVDAAILTIIKNGTPIFRRNLLEDPFNLDPDQPIVSKVVVSGRTSSIQVSTVPYPRYLGPSK